MKSLRYLSIGLVALAASLAANLAAATIPSEVDVKTLVVRYSDLDLSKPQDAQRLYERIEHAAWSVCDRYPSTVRDLHTIGNYKLCIKRAVSEAVATVRATQPPERLYAQFGR